MIFEIENGVLVKARSESRCEDKKIILPSGIEVIGAGVFKGCDLEQIILPDGLREIAEGAFALCKNLTSITIPEGVTHILHCAFEYSGLTSIVLPDSLMIIGKEAFAYSDLRTVRIPGSVSQIEYGAFSYCRDLRTIEVVQGVTQIGSDAFWGCVNLHIAELPESLDYIDKSAFATSGEVVFYVKKDSYAYNFALQEKYSVQSGKATISNDLILRCLKHNYFNISFVPDREYTVNTLNELPVHLYCLVDNESASRIHSIGLYIPSLFEQHKSGKVWTDGYFFTEKRLMPFGNRLKRIKISLKHNPDYINDTTGKKQVRVLEFNDYFLFCDAVHIDPEQCYFLDSYVCTENDADFGVVRLGNGKEWNNICHLVVPEGFAKIDDCACVGAQNLESVYIGNTVSYIGNDSFCSCPKLTTVYVGGSVDAYHTRAFNNCPELRSVTMSVDLKNVILSKRAMCKESDWPWFVDCPQLKEIRFSDGFSIPL